MILKAGFGLLESILATLLAGVIVTYLVYIIGNALVETKTAEDAFEEELDFSVFESILRIDHATSSEKIVSDHSVKFVFPVIESGRTTLIDHSFQYDPSTETVKMRRGRKFERFLDEVDNFSIKKLSPGDDCFQYNIETERLSKPLIMIVCD